MIRVLLAGLVFGVALPVWSEDVPNPDRPTRSQSGKVTVSTDPKSPPARGPAAAKVVVLVFTDFQCPVCRRITDATYQIAEEFPGDVRLELRPIGMASHPLAEDAAIAALAAHQQGKFWPMHDALFENQQALDAASLRATAERLGLDLKRYDRDVKNPALRARVRADDTLAEQLGAVGTPGFVINGKASVGWSSWLGFRSVVEQELTAMNALVGKGTSVAAARTLRIRQQSKDPKAFAAHQQALAAPPAARRK